MPFLNQTLKVETWDGRKVTLLEPLVYVSEGGVTYTVPAGSQSDGASTPPAIWPTIPPFGKYWPAAVLHDWAYRYSDLPKQECDWLLKEAMRSLGVEDLLSDTIYEAVHLAGGSSFEGDRNSRKNA